MTEKAKVLIQTIRSLMLNHSKPLLVAIDGRSGVGKSTLARAIVQELGGVIVQGDDFFSGGADCEWDAKSAQEKVAECIDWRRLRKEALEPLLAGKLAAWHPFDFISGNGLSEMTEKREPSSLVILDGAYSCRPELADIIDFAVLIELSDDQLRRKRLRIREGDDFMESWHKRWDSAEEHYFEEVINRLRFNLIITV